MALNSLPSLTFALLPACRCGRFEQVACGLGLLLLCSELCPAQQSHCAASQRHALLRHCPLDSGAEQLSGSITSSGHNYLAYLQQDRQGLHEPVRLRLLSELAFGAFELQGNLPQSASSQLWALMHLRGELALEAQVAACKNFLSLEFSSSSRLDHAGRRSLGLGSSYNQPAVLHNDIFGDDFYYLPEYAWCYRGDGRSLLVGVINQGNYLDVNEMANCSYNQFVHSALVNNSALLLADSNLGLLYQYNADKHVYYNIAASFVDVAPRHNPLEANANCFNLQFEAARQLHLLTSNSSLRLQTGMYKLDEQFQGVVAGSLVEHFSDNLKGFVRLGLNSAASVTASAAPGFNRHCSIGAELKDPLGGKVALLKQLEQYWRFGGFWQRALSADGQPACYNYGLESSYSWHFGEHAKLSLLAQRSWSDSNLPARNSFMWGVQTTLSF